MRMRDIRLFPAIGQGYKCGGAEENIEFHCIGI